MLLLSDPGLILKLFWKVAKAIPSHLASHVTSTARSLIEEAPASVVLHHPMPMPLEFAGHEMLPSPGPPLGHRVAPATAESPISSGLWMLFAGEGGALISLVCAFKAGVLNVGGGV